MITIIIAYCLVAIGVIGVYKSARCYALDNYLHLRSREFSRKAAFYCAVWHPNIRLDNRG